MPLVQSAVLIGRFQPPHLAHLALMDEALARHGRLLVLLGSANLARSVKNPFGAPERARLIRQALGPAARRVRFRPLPDRFDADRWAIDVRSAVAAAGISNSILVGFEKDSSSSYLRWFPDWPLDELPGTAGVHATDLRAALWRRDWEIIAPQVHPTTLDRVRAFSHTRTFARLVAEQAAIEVERARQAPGHIWRERFGLWSGNDRVALVLRNEAIGAGLLSLPPVQASAGELLGVFDHPARSLLGPSEAWVYRLTQPPTSARLRLTDQVLARPRRFFEDHAVILARLLRQG